jgi:hypothetical protein
MSVQQPSPSRRAQARHHMCVSTITPIRQEPR